MARKARMTEGQLYTVVVVALAVLLLTLTGLPNAHRRDQPDTPVSAGSGASGHLPSVSEADDPSTAILAIVSAVVSQTPKSTQKYGPPASTRVTSYR